MQVSKFVPVTLALMFAVTAACRKTEDAATDSPEGSMGANRGDGSANRLQALVPWPNLETETSTIVKGGEHDAAVIVALESYVFVPSVPGAVANGVAWQRYFTATLGVPVDRVRILTGAEATKDNIEPALDRAAKQALSGGRVWFVFIGHGAPSRTGTDGLLLGADVQRTTDSLEQRSLRQSDVIARLEHSQAQPVLVLDACFSGQTASDEALCEGCQPVMLADTPAPKRAIVLSAARSDQVAGPLPGRAQPAFSYLALGALRGWGDEDGDGSVTATEVIAYTNGALGAVVKGRSQTPELLGSGAVTLVKSAGERGPDLAEIQRILSQGGSVNFNGDGIVLTELPTLTLRDVGRDELAGEIDLSKIDMVKEREMEAQYVALQSAKKQVDAARAAAKDDPTGVKQEQAWCDLADLPDPNPYRAEAQKACLEVQTYVEQRKRLLAAMERDWTEKVVPFMGLQHRSLEDKQKVMQAFVNAYGVLGEQPEVESAITSLAELERGVVPKLTSTPSSAVAVRPAPPAVRPAPPAVEPKPANDLYAPDGDNDGDKVRNGDDICPDSAETFNGFEDHDGCSDQIPNQLATVVGILETVSFRTGSDKLESSSFEILDKVAKTLKDFPAVRIEISGHTDDQGETQANIDLSLRRAIAVQQYLVDRGIDQARIKTQGYGPTQPLVMNDTKANRAKNRRIEFKLITTP